VERDHVNTHAVASAVVKKKSVKTLPAPPKLPPGDAAFDVLSDYFLAAVTAAGPTAMWDEVQIKVR
jgi:hypothetical protein